MSELKHRASGKVVFQYFQDDRLYYKCLYDGFIFPVPVSDCKGARFRAEEKGLLFLRWIGRYMKDIEEQQATQCGAV